MGQLLLIFTMLFFCCLGTVFRLIAWPVTLMIVVGVLLAVGRPLLRQVDYGLLATFFCFFIFTGNMGQIAWVQQSLLGAVVAGQGTMGCGYYQSIYQQCACCCAVVRLYPAGQNAAFKGCDIGGLGYFALPVWPALLAIRHTVVIHAADKKAFLKIFFTC